MFEERGKIIWMTFGLTGLIFVLRLLYIQIFDTDYKVFAENNALRKEIIQPARGLIYDTKGRILVNNETSYDLFCVPNKIEKDFDIKLICKILDLDTSYFRQAVQEARTYSLYRPSPILKGISLAQFGKLQERLYQFPGFSVEVRTTRTYPKAIASHVLGYLGEVNDSDIKKSDNYYRLGDYIGTSGLEKVYEKDLMGVKGVRNVLVDVLNREQGSYLNGKYDIPAVAGSDLLTSLDLELQEYGEKLMAGRQGSIVAMNPQTGEILAMVSFPSYDPNLLVGRKRNKNIYQMIKDPAKPMFNRAISARYPPGSTIKPMMALLSLDEHLLTPSTVFPCNGGYKIGRKIIKCHAPGSYDLHGSIQMSCNSYYCYAFRNFIDQKRFAGHSDEGLQHWKDRLSEFGLGTKLGIDVTNENKGIVPSPKIYDKAYGLHRWRSSTIISLGIGQAEISLTPLQICNMAVCIANNGYYYTPHFVKGLDKSGKVFSKSWPIHKINIKSNYFDFIKDAMQDVVDRGTAILAKIPGIEVCGKTGTAQNPHGEDHSIFMGFAPKTNPKIAVAIVIENAGFGGTWAAPLGALIMEKYLKDSITDKMSLWSEKRILDMGQKLTFSQAYAQSLKDTSIHIKPPNPDKENRESKKGTDSKSIKMDRNNKPDVMPDFPRIDTSKIRESTGED